MRDDAESTGPAHRYTAALANEVELRWQAKWDELGTYRQPNPGEPGFDEGRPKFYCLDMFPYPSGAGLHVGHPEGYTATDIVSRYKRMTGFNVLHPMGWDAFGLPAEQHAINTGEHPAGFTRETIANFKRQLKRFGFSYDWSREFATIDEGYYRWTQWIFLRIYGSWFDPELKKARPIGELVASFESGEREPAFNPDAAEIEAGRKDARPGPWADLDAATRRAVIDSYRLAYLGEQTVNWCPKLGTALANEEVIDGRSERGGHPVFRKPLRQWLFRITAYGDRLLEGLAGVSWPESTKAQQTEWIGRSEGAEVRFVVELGPGERRELAVYTTRPDTLFGVTYMVVAPEHPLVVEAIGAAERAEPARAGEIRAYAQAASRRSDLERQESKDKTGVALGLDAVNPVTGERVPVWAADYVLMGYGTGAIMAVPGHDERDFEFARAMGLPIREVVAPPAVAVMSWYSREMSDAEADTEAWASVLADLLGYTTSYPTAYQELAKALHTVRTRRRATDGPGGPDGDEAHAKRGVVRGGWVDAIREMKLDSPGALRRRFERGVDQSAVLEGAFAGGGVAVNSSAGGVSLDGLPTAEAKRVITAWLEERGLGRGKVNYRLRDWLFSRQRYWGEPFPIVFDEAGDHHPVGDAALPVTLPALADYEPEESDEPVPLLAKARDWITTTAGEAGVEGLPPDAPVTREANTMPGWAGSCWYHLRYADPGNASAPAGERAERYWLGDGVDLYIGGAEHAVLHLLYSRFWHKVLFDLGHVSSDEPYRRLFHQGLILSHAFQRADRGLVAVDAVTNRGTEDEPSFVETETGEPVSRITAKMSKSLRNVVNPDDVIAEYGADTFRVYEMYMGPLEQAKPWNTRDISGMFRFLRDVWRLCVDEETGAVAAADTPDPALEKLLHRTIAKVAGDIDRLAFNTAIAALIEFKNAATPKGGGGGTLSRDQVRRLALTLAPFCPHAAEELWHRLGLLDGLGSVHAQPWPEVDPAMLVDDEVEIPVQVNGKVRARITVAAGADADTVRAAAEASPAVAAQLDGKTVRKVVAIPGKMVNFVAS